MQLEDFNAVHTEDNITLEINIRVLDNDPELAQKEVGGFCAASSSGMGNEMEAPDADWDSGEECAQAGYDAGYGETVYEESTRSCWWWLLVGDTCIDFRAFDQYATWQVVDVD